MRKLWSKGSFDFWDKEKRQTHLYSLFYALDYAIYAAAAAAVDNNNNVYVAKPIDNTSNAANIFDNIHKNVYDSARIDARVRAVRAAKAYADVYDGC